MGSAGNFSQESPLTWAYVKYIAEATRNTDNEDDNHPHSDNHTDTPRVEDNNIAEREDDKESKAHLLVSIQMVPVLHEIRSRTQDNLNTHSTTDKHEGNQESSSVEPPWGQYEQTISDVSLWDNPNPSHLTNPITCIVLARSAHVQWPRSTPLKQWPVTPANNASKNH